MKDYSQILMNPLFAASLKASGNPIGQSLLESSQVQRQNELAQAQTQKHQFEIQEKQREAMLAESLPQVLKEIDWNNPQEAQAKLAGAGLKPQEIVTLFGVHKGIQDIDYDKNKLSHEMNIDNQTLGLRREELGQRRAEHSQEKTVKPTFFEGADKQQYEVIINPETGQREARALPGQGIASQNLEEITNIEKGIRGELKKDVEDYENIKGSFDNIRDLSKQKTGASDMGMVYSYVKLLDPTSTVGPGEKATAENSGGIPENVRGQINHWLGKGSLSDTQRKNLIEGAKTLYGTKAKSYKKKTSQYKDLAKRYKANPSNVVLNEPEDVPESDVNSPVSGGENIPQNGFSIEAAAAELARRRASRGQ